MPTHLQRILASPHATKLFDSEQGNSFLLGAINQLRHGAACASKLSFVLADGPTPKHILSDILTQTYNLLETVGACEFALALTAPEPNMPPDMHDMYIELFATVYSKGCAGEESLRKLCKSTVNTYLPLKDRPNVYN